jgi:signal transduction histidine kinase
VTVAVAIAIAAVVLVEAGRSLRAAARDRRLNRALHELRRPLQAIALVAAEGGGGAESTEACLRQARRAIEDLDAVINGGSPTTIIRRAPLAEIVAALERRWRFADVEVDGVDGDGGLDADIDRLGAALDNLVANALRHGTGRVSVRVRSEGGCARFEVRDGGPERAPAPRRRPDPRHGHGLGVAAGTAARAGGSLIGPAPVPGGGTVAAISLPVAEGGGGGRG